MLLLTLYKIIEDTKIVCAHKGVSICLRESRDQCQASSLMTFHFLRQGLTEVSYTLWPVSSGDSCPSPMLGLQAPYDHAWSFLVGGGLGAESELKYS